MAMMNPAVATLVDLFNQADRQTDFDYLDWTLRVEGEIDDQWSWQATAAQKHRAPSYQELFVWFSLGISAGQADGRNYLGNLQLNEERADKIELGLNYQSQNLQFSPRVFYDDISDYIVGSLSTNDAANRISTMMTGQPPLQWTNADVSLYGFDLLLSVQLSQQWSLVSNAQYVRAERDDLNEPLFRIAPATLLTQLKWNQDALTATVEVLLAAEQDRTSDLLNETPSAGYGVLNLLADYEVAQWLSVSLRVNNLLDKQYQPHVNGVNRVAMQDLAQGQRLPEPGRNISIGFSATF
jgi:iron complex outermembrane receptor protein